MHHNVKTDYKIRFLKQDCHVISSQGACELDSYNILDRLQLNNVMACQVKPQTSIALFHPCAKCNRKPFNAKYRPFILCFKRALVNIFDKANVSIGMHPCYIVRIQA